MVSSLVTSVVLDLVSQIEVIMSHSWLEISVIVQITGSLIVTISIRYKYIHRKQLLSVLLKEQFTLPFFSLQLASKRTKGCKHKKNLIFSTISIIDLYFN